MTITIRLPDPIEQELRRRLEVEGKALSEFVRQAIVEKLAREPAARPSAYELGRHLFDRHGDGDRDGSEERKSRVREIVDAQHRRR